MTQQLGKVRPGSTLRIFFDSYAGSTGASSTLSGLAVTDIEVFKDGSMTQRASDSGYSLLDTDGIDLDTITGVNGIAIDLADNTTAGFWAAGSEYHVVLASVTVDGQTVNKTLAQFTIGYEGSVLDTTIATLDTQTSFTLTNGPAEDNVLNGREVIIHDVASAVQWSGGIISDYVGSTKTVTLAGNPTFTIAAGDNVSVMGLAPLQPTTAGRTLLVESDGMVQADLRETLGVAVVASDLTLAAVSAGTSVTFPTTDSRSVAIPDDARYEYTVWQIVAGTGNGQLLFTTTKTGVRQFAYVSGFTPVAPSTDSQLILIGSWRSSVSYFGDTAGTFNAGVPDVRLATGVTHGGASTGITADVTGNLSGSVGSVTGAVGSVTATVGADVVSISGDGPAADAFESYLDGTAYMPVDAHRPDFAFLDANTVSVKTPAGTEAYTKTVATSASTDGITGTTVDP